MPSSFPSSLLTPGLAPGLLLAAPSMQDPNFAKAVILLGRHDEDGALGWVVNGREIAPVEELVRASELFPEDTVFPQEGAFQAPARYGGPVEPATGWLFYPRTPEALPGQMDLGPKFGVSGELSAFSGLVEGDGPSDFSLLLGCAGWGPTQLESEVREGAWLPVDLGPENMTALLAQVSAGKTGPGTWDQAYRLATGLAPGFSPALSAKRRLNFVSITFAFCQKFRDL